MITDLPPPFYGDTGNFTIMIRGMNFLRILGQALHLELQVPWRIGQTFPCFHEAHNLLGRKQKRNQ